MNGHSIRMHPLYLHEHHGTACHQIVALHLLYLFDFGVCYRLELDCW